MLKTIKEILRVGTATIAYPDAPLERPDYVRGKPEHDLDRCIACGACANNCPPNAIQMTNDPQEGTITWSISFGRCIFCGRCQEVCPTGAIELGKEFELAVFDREDMQQSCTYPLQKCCRCGIYYASAKQIAYAREVLYELAENVHVRWAIDLASYCPECKQAIDAKRFKDMFDRAGDLTAEPTEEQMEKSRLMARLRREADVQ